MVKELALPVSTWHRFSPRRIAAGFLLSGVLGGAGMCASVLIVGLRLAAPAYSTVGPPPGDLRGAKNVEIPSASGSLLQGWWMPAEELGQGAIVLMHGVWSNRRTMVQRARVLH